MQSPSLLDGRYIAALSDNQTKVFLYSFETAQWKPVPLPQGNNVAWPSWSHDSRYLYVIDGSLWKFRVPDGPAELARDLSTVDITSPIVSVRGMRSLPTTAFWSCATAASTNSTPSTSNIAEHDPNTTTRPGSLRASVRSTAETVTRLFADLKNRHIMLSKGSQSAILNNAALKAMITT